MGGQEDVNAKPLESDKPVEVTRTPDRPQVDVTKALEERVQLSKSDETYTKLKRFTIGDGEFGIDGFASSKGAAEPAVFRPPSQDAGTEQPSDVVLAGATVIPDKAEPIDLLNPPKGDYWGEGIERDVAVGKHTVKEGDTLEGIARKHLGPGASQADVAKYTEEIRRQNNIENPKLIHPGDQLQLPGHTKDGAYITEDKNGSKRTVWPGGKEKLERKDGTGYERQPMSDGGYVEKGFSTKPEEVYQIRKHGDDGHKTYWIVPPGEYALRKADRNNGDHLHKIRQIEDRHKQDQEAHKPPGGPQQRH